MSENTTASAPQVASNEVKALTREQANFAASIFGRWMDVCEDYGAGTSRVDVDHSSLLMRLLMGGSLHDQPPPKRFSYPAWELVELPEVEVNEVHDSAFKPGKVTVDQHSEYEWEDREAGILRYPRLGLRWRVEKRTVTPYGRVSKNLNPEDYKYEGTFLVRLDAKP